MKRSSAPLPLVLALVCASGCEDLIECPDEDSEALPALSRLTTTPTVPVTGDFKLSGGLQSRRRIFALRVNGANVKGVTDNYQAWEHVLPIAELRELAFGEQAAGARLGSATVEIVAEDVCGRSTVLETLEIPVGRAPGSEPLGQLTVATTLPTPGVWADGEPHCYAPSDGSKLARVHLASSDPADLGILVAVKSSRGALLPGAEAGLALRSGDGAPELELSLQVADRLDGPVTIYATAGTTTEQAAELLYAGPPGFSGASGMIAVGVPVKVNVSTLGALARCKAEDTSGGAKVTINVDGGKDLLASGHDFEAPSECGQLVGIDVQFPQDAVEFSTVRISCADVFGQTASLSLIANVP